MACSDEVKIFIRVELKIFFNCFYFLSQHKFRFCVSCLIVICVSIEPKRSRNDKSLKLSIDNVLTILLDMLKAFESHLIIQY